MGAHKILLVDDEPDILEYVKVLVKRSGEFQVETAEDGEQALTKILANDYDCVLSDIKMPVLDGVSMLERVRAAGRDVPVLFMSAFADASFERQVVGYGAVTLLDKTKMRDVVGRIQEALCVGDDTRAMHAEEGGMAGDFLALLNHRR